MVTDLLYSLTENLWFLFFHFLKVFLFYQLLGRMGEMTKSEAVETVFLNWPLKCARRPEAVSQTGGNHLCFLFIVQKDEMVRWVDTVPNISVNIVVVVHS